MNLWYVLLLCSGWLILVLCRLCRWNQIPYVFDQSLADARFDICFGPQLCLWFVAQATTDARPSVHIVADGTPYSGWFIAAFEELLKPVWHQLQTRDPDNSRDMQRLHDTWSETGPSWIPHISGSLVASPSFLGKIHVGQPPGYLQTFSIFIYIPILYL